MIITLSFAVPPAVDEITEGVEKSLVARHMKNLSAYSEQLVRLILDAETVLTDQDTEDKNLIPIYYGIGHTQPIAAARQFVDKPLNMLKPRELAEEPFDHIFVHNYGFGGFCDKAEEEKIVRGIADLAVAHKITKNPAILSVLMDISEEPVLDENAVAHRKIVRGIFAKLSGEDLGIEKDDLIDRSVDAIIADNKCFHYMENLKELIDNSPSIGQEHVPFERSPYNNHYLANFLSDRFREAKESFPWIHKVTLIDIPAPKIPASNIFKTSTAPVVSSRIRTKSDKKESNSDLKDSPEGVKKKEVIIDHVDTPSDKVSHEVISSADNSPVNDAVRHSRYDRVVSETDCSSAAVEDQQAAGENTDADPGEKKEDASNDADLEDFVKVDDQDISDNYLSDESYGLASSEVTPQRPTPKSPLQNVYSSISSASSSSSYDSSSSTDDSPIVSVLPGENDPYHIG